MCITFFNGSGVASWRKYSRSPTPRWYHWNTPSHRAHRSAVASEEPWWHNSSRVNYHLNHWGCVIFNGMEPRLIQAWGWRRVYRGFPKFLWRIFISSRILFEDPEDIHLICRYLNVGKGIFFFFSKNDKPMEHDVTPVSTHCWRVCCWRDRMAYRILLLCISTVAERFANDTWHYTNSLRRKRHKNRNGTKTVK